MSRRPKANVQVLNRTDLAAGCLRIEVSCRFSTTGLTSIATERIGLTVPVLITTACYEHESRCGECDVSQAHERGDQHIRTVTEDAWNAAGDEE